MPDAYNDILRGLIARTPLTREQSRGVFEQIMTGAWSEAQIAAVLTALAVKGETVEEIAGAAEVMRAHVVPVETGDADVVDTCGTGGTGLSTFNVSTAAAMVLAGAGVKVAKHGNRTSTRASGSANVLDALGVNLDAPPETQARCLDQAGVCFCYAIKHHPAMKYAMPVRKQLAVRTIFNLLGPLTNPAGARRQVMGLFDADLTETIAEVLGALGAVHAMTLHADDGLDEISVTCETKVSEFADGAVRTYRVSPEEFGMQRASLGDLLVASATESAEVIRGVLAGDPGPARDLVLLNAAAALVVADRAGDLAAGVPMAAESIDSGNARGALETLIRVSNGS